MFAVVGAAAPDGDDLLLASLVFGDDGEVVNTYAKKHPHGQERELFRAGEKPTLVDVDGWALGMAICRDAALPEHAAEVFGAGADVYVVSALYEAGTERRRDDHLRARSADHGGWAVLATHGDETGGYRTTGGSGVWDPAGRLVAQAGAGVPDLAVATLHPGTV
ncbi:Carbon-nitrogen hydrolase [Streptoalloteichus hindustanus]|uniref:Carbon-nitrogen hydrolase n=1 Tax=Streptoalloteichus hindustanus TaxID=2017 RepID=A0A1M5KF52_STRHI|nr:Carbon-nitrogen hydrolase [Streptoalloteichus hindustanus]